MSADGSTVSLFVVVDQPWTVSEDEVTSLKEKLNGYVVFVVDGALTDAYPETAGLAWEVVIDTQVGAPPEHVQAVLDHFGQAVQQYGGTLRMA
jgi:hypothetical protein